MSVSWPRIREVGTTDTTWDRAFSTDSANWPYTIVWRNQTWPIIMGGADDDSGDSGDSTSGENDDATSGDQDDSSQDDEKTFTQAQVNSLVTREVSRATRGKLDPKELGFDSAKEMRDWIESQKSKADEDKTQQDKDREQAIEQAKRDAEAEVLSTANQRVLKAEFLLAAMDAGIEKAAREDAFLLAQTLDAWQDVDVDDKGVVSGFDETFFDELKEKKPYLFATKSDDANDRRGPGDLGGGRRNSGGGGNNREEHLKSVFPALKQYSG